MSKNKLFKVFSLLSFLAIPIFSGLISLTLSSESNKTGNFASNFANKINYDNKLSKSQEDLAGFKQKNKKIFSRKSNQKFTAFSLLKSSNVKNVLKAENVNIKIFLDLIDTNNNSLSANVEYYQTKNNEYLKQITSLFEENNIKINSSYVSKLSPIIWININSLAEKKSLELLEKLDFVSLVINNIENTTNSDSLPTYSAKSLNQEVKPKIFYSNLEHAAYYYAYLSNTKDYFTKEKEIVDYKYPGPYTHEKVGVVEVGMSGTYDESDWLKAQIPKYLVNYYNIGRADSKKTNENQNDHASLVSGIIVGKSGFAFNTDLHLANLGEVGSFDSPVWMSIFEKLIIEKGVRVINHSYGFNFIHKKDVDAEFKDIYGNNSSLLKNSVSRYIDHLYYLDFLSRKYGVINIFAAGNEYDDKWKNDIKNSEEKYGYISGYANAINSIVVGSSFGTKENFYASNFSNRLLPKGLKGLPKPLIVAPGENIVGLSDQKSPESGTSFSAPIVTGIVSTIIGSNHHLFHKNNIIPAIKSVLSSSAVDSKLDYQGIKNFIESTKKENEKQNTWSSIDDYLERPSKWLYLLNYENEHKSKSNGFDTAVGAGQINFANIQKAIDNLKTFSVSFQNTDEYVYVSPEIKLNQGDKIKASLAWAFNAGLTKPVTWNDSRFYSWYANLVAYGSGWYILDNNPGAMYGEYHPQSSIEEEYHHKYPYEWLKRKALFEKQKNTLFSDYDLKLQKKEGDNWQTIYLNSGSSWNSNVELIRYSAEESGIYRILVKKHSSSLFEESVDDNLAVSYVIQEK
ncbi:S8 family serine peptidase [Mesomycoplasma ovipneumoniae]|uniref:S8 family serine peptidase n=1 Tax=Mesomycoplasma ovipneumoniae TaxID=29562 RepID=UPI0029642594|nr:S8 family serine peptidase [Mesomycoplasma ovipneumoniae]MDW2892242.1 S8 family serine peptidase [Mesomycoplasma ovipneumoniae]